jgi:two-component system chemotaxis response regulator CheB
MESENDRQSAIQQLKAEAVNLYQQKQFVSSLRLWQKIAEIDPKNSLAMVYVRRIQHEMARAKSPTPPQAAPAVSHRAEPPAPQPAQAHPQQPHPQQPDLRSGAEPSSCAAPAGRTQDVPKPIKVMIVDDSSMMLKAIGRMLAKNPSIEVVKAVGSGEEALNAIPQSNPDVITLDVNMPGMDGITTLKHIMVQFPRPVIMLSAFTEEGSAATFDCLFYGAIDFICKPSRGAGNLNDQQEEVHRKVLKAAAVKVSSPKKVRIVKKGPKQDSSEENAKWVVAMGAEEGGYSSYLKIIPHLPAKIPCAILAVQYSQESHLRSFCEYLNRTSRIAVKEAEQGELIKEGVCYFTHHGNYLKIEQSSEGAYCQLTPRPALISQQNVVNQLFFSVGEKFASQSLGVLLTGNGVDGVEGLQELKRVRATTLVQDPATCLASQAVAASLQAQCVDQSVKDSDLAGMVWHLLKTRQGR